MPNNHWTRLIPAGDLVPACSNRILVGGPKTPTPTYFMLVVFEAKEVSSTAFGIDITLEIMKGFRMAIVDKNGVDITSSSYCPDAGESPFRRGKCSH